jgi:hypothetical protein
MTAKVRIADVREGGGHCQSPWGGGRPIAVPTASIYANLNRIAMNKTLNVHYFLARWATMARDRVGLIR